MDLNLIINNTLADLNEEGFLEEVVRKNIEETVRETVRSSVQTYSKFGKSLKEEVEKLLEINFDQIDIPSYNQIILDIVKQGIDKAIKQEGAMEIEESIKQMLGTAESEYRLSDLINEIVEEDCDLDELSYGESKEITVIIKDSYGFKHIYIDPEYLKEWHSCKYQIMLNHHGKVATVKLSDKSFDIKMVMDGLYGPDATLFKMWTRKANLIIDNYETEFTNPEYDN